MMLASFTSLSVQQFLLSVTLALVSRFPVLQAMPVVEDTRGPFPNTADGEEKAWEYAIANHDLSKYEGIISLI